MIWKKGVGVVRVKWFNLEDDQVSHTIGGSGEGGRGEGTGVYPTLL